MSRLVSFHVVPQSSHFTHCHPQTGERGTTRRWTSMPTSAEFSGESGVIGSVVMSQLGRSPRHSARSSLRGRRVPIRIRNPYTGLMSSSQCNGNQCIHTLGTLLCAVNPQLSRPVRDPLRSAQNKAFETFYSSCFNWGL